MIAHLFLENPMKTGTVARTVMETVGLTPTHLILYHRLAQLMRSLTILHSGGIVIVMDMAMRPMVVIQTSVQTYQE